MTSFDEAAKAVRLEDYVTHFMETAGGDWEPYRRVLYASQLDAFTYGKTVSYPCDAHAYKLKSGRIWDYESGWRNRTGWIAEANEVVKNIPPNIFAQASDIIYGDREKTYGHPAKNLERIAHQWTLYLQQKYSTTISITPEDVCWMMADLKKARQMNEDKHDNLLDAIGYIGLIDRIKGEYQG